MQRATRACYGSAEIWSLRITLFSDQSEACISATYEQAFNCLYLSGDISELWRIVDAFAVSQKIIKDGMLIQFYIKAGLNNLDYHQYREFMISNIEYAGKGINL